MRAHYVEEDRDVRTVGPDASTTPPVNPHNSISLFISLSSIIVYFFLHICVIHSYLLVDD